MELPLSVLYQEATSFVFFATSTWTIIISAYFEKKNKKEKQGVKSLVDSQRLPVVLIASWRGPFVFSIPELSIT